MGLNYPQKRRELICDVFSCSFCRPKIEKINIGLPVVVHVRRTSYVVRRTSYVCTYGDHMGFLWWSIENRLDGYPFFLKYGAPLRGPSARAELRYKFVFKTAFLFARDNHPDSIHFEITNKTSTLCRGL